MNIAMPDGLIGDSLMPEAAMYAYYEKTGKQVNFYCPLWFSYMYEGNPAINLVPEELPDSFRFDCSKALNYAYMHYVYFGAAFMDQIPETKGLDKSAVRSWYRYHNSVPSCHYTEYVAIAPFSRSCSIHQTGLANKTIDISWWETLVPKLGKQVVSLGGLEDPPVRGTVNLRGQDLRYVLSIIQNADSFVTGDTGLMHIAYDVQPNIICLNAANKPWIVNPGNMRVLQSSVPPSWKHKDVLKLLV